VTVALEKQACRVRLEKPSSKSQTLIARQQSAAARIDVDTGALGQ
jgi:hypothetical protein